MTRAFSAATAVLAVSVFAQTPARAQDGEGETAQQTPAAVPAAAEPVTVGGATTPPVVNFMTTPGGQTGLPAPGTDLEAHLGSSSQARVDINQGDTFDFGPGSSAAGTLRGNADAPGILADEVQGNTGVYLVKAGDTLSRISQQVYGQPWMWPKLWSLNPQIQNPHWIYPGDQIRLTGAVTPAARSALTLGANSLGGLRKSVPPGTIFLRRLGYIDDPNANIMGEVVGAVEAVQMMSEGQRAYLVMRPEHPVKVGQLLSVFSPSRRPPVVKGARRPPGQIVAIKGSAKIEFYDPETKIARARLTESLDVIERGMKVGLVGREFPVVAPVPATKNVSSRVLTSMYPHVFFGQHQVVFIDRGKNDGLSRGNRLFVIRRGDTWRRTLDTATITARSRIKMDVPESLQVENTPLRGDEQKFPEEVVAELRIIETHKFSAFAVVSESSTEILPGDRAVARSGF